MAWRCISPVVTVNGLKKCCISSAVHETDDDMLWNGSEEDRNIRSSARKMKTLTIKMRDSDTDCKGRLNTKFIVYWVYEINSKIFFSRHIFQGGGVS